MKDPYLYPGTQTLVNYFGIHDHEKLQEVESAFFRVSLGKPLPVGKFDYEHLKAIHHHLFGQVYPWAGQERTVDIAKENSYFGAAQHISRELNKIFVKLEQDSFLRGLERPEFCQKLAFYFSEINAAHPFREGNGRTQRIFCEELSRQAGYRLNWSAADPTQYMTGSKESFQGNLAPLIDLLSGLVTPIHMALTENTTTSHTTEPELNDYEKLLKSAKNHPEKHAPEALDNTNKKSGARRRGRAR